MSSVRVARAVAGSPPQRLLPDLAPPIASVVARVLGLDELVAIHAARPAGCDGRQLVAWALQALRIGVEATGEERIPESGGLLVVSNHPFGGADGLAVAECILRRRRDLRILGNEMLARIDGLAELVIPVDVFGAEPGRRGNAASLRRALAWLRGGGALLVFPAGEVAHFRARQRRVIESPWSPSIAGLARHGGAAVLPVHVDGCNRARFHAAGLAHPLLRTALLPRELLARRGTNVRLRVGAPIPPAVLEQADDDAAAVERMRWRCEILAPDGEAASRRVPRREAALAPALDPATLEREVRALPGEATLVEGRDACVLLVSAAQAPSLLREIGRLRELAFREAGEGTGRSLDLDRFDETYRHLVTWSHERREVIGSYRVGAVDELVRAKGMDALYTSTLFDLDPELACRLGPALELGRSFVRPECQRSASGLPLLWRGLAALASRESHRPVLMGPVSISADLGLAARRVLHEYLGTQQGDPDLARLVRPRTPWRQAASWPDGRARCADLEDVARLVEAADPGGPGLPVLVKQYAKLGARVLGLNEDRDFGGVIDALIVVDLRRVERRVLDKFMGKDAASRWRASQG